MPPIAYVGCFLEASFHPGLMQADEYPSSRSLRLSKALRLFHAASGRVDRRDAVGESPLRLEGFGLIEDLSNKTLSPIPRAVIFAIGLPYRGHTGTIVEELIFRAVFIVSPCQTTVFPAHASGILFSIYRNLLSFLPLC